MIKIGIIGAGNFSQRHMKAIGKVENIELKAICRRDTVGLKILMDTFGVAGYTDYRLLLKDPSIDAVLIATPHHLHGRIAVDAAESGKHILLEKPFASSWEDCKNIYDACKVRSVKLMIAHVGQFTAAFQKGKSFLNSGGLGEIHMARGISVSFWKHSERQDWHLEKNSGGGYLLTLAVHQIDLICALIPSRVETVYPKITNKFHSEEVDDGGIIVLNFANGFSASLQIFHSSP